MMKIFAILVLVVDATGAHALSVLGRGQSANATRETSGAPFFSNEGWLSPGSSRSPKAECTSLFRDATSVVDIAKADKRGCSEQAGKKLTVDDVLFGYDVLFEDQKLYDKITWKGMLMQQDPSDAIAIQMMLWKEKPDLMIEFGTNTGGGAVFYAEIMTGYNPNAHVITLDVENRIGKSWAGAVPGVRADSSPLWGHAVRHVVGLPPSKEVQTQVRALVKEFGAKKVFINEDGSHHAEHVFQNVEAYHDLVPECGWILFQDTKLDRMRGCKGPVAAQTKFMSKYPGYKVKRDYELFLYTQHAGGFVQKTGPACQ